MKIIDVRDDGPEEEEETLYQWDSNEDRLYIDWLGLHLVEGEDDEEMTLATYNNIKNFIKACQMALDEHKRKNEGAD